MATVIPFKNPPHILCAASVGGREEARGPLAPFFDHLDKSSMFGMKSFEDAEGEMERLCLSLAMKKGNIRKGELSLLFAGDLQNQCVASANGLFSFGIPYLGLYGACSTCAESLLCLSLAISHGTVDMGAAVTSSHNAAAERQFRLPLEYGGQRTPSASWTATAAGAFILGREGRAVIREGAAGKLIDGATKDSTNMGAAMAPAAADTVLSYLSCGGFSLREIDRIVTGDLGRVGSELFLALLKKDGVDIREKHLDCGLLLYDKGSEDFHSGASGCGCSASVLAARLLPALEKGEFSRILFLSTGALMSPQSTQQKHNILGVAHGVLIEREGISCS